MFLMHFFFFYNDKTFEEEKKHQIYWIDNFITWKKDNDN